MRRKLDVRRGEIPGQRVDKRLIVGFVSRGGHERGLSMGRGSELRPGLVRVLAHAAHATSEPPRDDLSGTNP